MGVRAAATLMSHTPDRRPRASMGRLHRIWLTTLLLAAASVAAQPVPQAEPEQINRLRPLDFTPFTAPLAALKPETIAEVEDMLRRRSIDELQAAMASGALTSETLTLVLLHRIRIHDDRLRSYIALNPRALDDARAADRERVAGQSRGPLHGIPISLKDNIDTAGPMQSTAGALILKDHVAKTNAPLVTALKAAGAIILGKANLSELAGMVHQGNRMGGTSAVGGRAINPYGDDFATSGSSSGSAVATAALLAVASVGTETSGSLLSPAAKNGVVAIKPTQGLVSSQGILPVVTNNDGPGPVARSVRDAARLLAAIDTVDVDYAGGLTISGLSGKTVGVLAADILDDRNRQPLLQTAVSALTVAGAQLRPARIVKTLAWGDGVVFVKMLIGGIRHDLMPGMVARGAATRTPEELIAWMQSDPKARMPFGAETLISMGPISAGLTMAEHRANAAAARKAAAAMLDTAFRASQAEFLLSFEAVHSPLYATAGYPAVVIPIGVMPDGRPIPAGMTLIGKPGSDAALLSAAFAFEQASLARIPPAGL